jgi:hypothetical protein
MAFGLAGMRVLLAWLDPDNPALREPTPAGAEAVCLVLGLLLLG